MFCYLLFCAGDDEDEDDEHAAGKAVDNDDVISTQTTEAVGVVVGAIEKRKAGTKKRGAANITVHTAANALISTKNVTNKRRKKNA